MKKKIHSSPAPLATGNRVHASPGSHSHSNGHTPSPGARTLSIDVGGTGLKASVLDEHGKMIAHRQLIQTPHPCPPRVLVKALVELARRLPAFDRVSVGFPGYVRGDKVITAPEFGSAAWPGFDLVQALRAEFGKPVRLLNDADMQGLAVVRGEKLELVVTLGTGVGTALFRDGELMPHLELAHHPAHKRHDYNGYLGKRALKAVGRKKWNRRVLRMTGVLHDLFNFDRLYIGGGNSRNVTLKPNARLHIVPNRDGILGGIRLWDRKGEARAN